MKRRHHFLAACSGAVGLAVAIIALAPGATHLMAKEAPKEAAVAGGYSNEIAIEPLLRTSMTSSGDPIVYTQTSAPQVTAVKVTIPPGASTGWHEHPFPCYAYILSGTLHVELKGKPDHVLLPGEALVEVVNTPHNGINKGTEPVVLVMFATGEVGKPISIRLPGP